MFEREALLQPFDLFNIGLNRVFNSCFARRDQTTDWVRHRGQRSAQLVRDALDHLNRALILSLGRQLIRRKGHSDSEAVGIGIPGVPSQDAAITGRRLTVYGSRDIGAVVITIGDAQLVGRLRERKACAGTVSV